MSFEFSQPSQISHKSTIVSWCSFPICPIFLWNHHWNPMKSPFIVIKPLKIIKIPWNHHWTPGEITIFPWFSPWFSQCHRGRPGTQQIHGLLRSQPARQRAHLAGFVRGPQGGEDTIGGWLSIGKPWENHGKTIGKPWENGDKSWENDDWSTRQMVTFLHEALKFQMVLSVVPQWGKSLSWCK